MKGMFSSIRNLIKKGQEDGLVIVTGGKLDMARRLIEKMQTLEKSNIIVLYENYDNLKDDFYTKFEREDLNKKKKSSKNNINKLQVFNCDLKNQDDKEEFISFLENNKLKVIEYII